MKYLKISLLILVCVIITNGIFVFADDTFPLSGTAQVSSLTVGKTGTRNKINNERQELYISAATCNDCSFKAQPVFSNKSYTATTGISVGETVLLHRDAIATGTWYVKIQREDFSLINQTVGYTYDPNQLV